MWKTCRLAARTQSVLTASRGLRPKKPPMRRTENFAASPAATPLVLSLVDGHAQGMRSKKQTGRRLPGQSKIFPSRRGRLVAAREKPEDAAGVCMLSQCLKATESK
ncbi:hypothetical protein Efla_004980 [Eimeria flavescens]